TTDHLFQNDHQLAELTVGPNLQVLLGVYDNYQGEPGTVHSPELPAITPSTTYTGKWRAVAGGTTTAPAGKTAYTSDDLVKLYAGDTRPTAVTTYVWEPLVTLGQPVTIHYVDQRGKSIRATSELSGNVGSTYTIKPAKIRDYQFVKVSQGALKGTYSAKPQTVTLVYRKTTTPPVTPTTPSGNSNTNTSSSNSGSSTTSSTTPTTPAPTLKKGQAITAVKKLALYRTPNFSKHTRKFYYAKQPRTKWPQFLITGVAKSRAGHLRYLVRDVTPNNKRKGQTGYVTAQAAFTVKTYYQHAPKRVKILTGTNAYREVALKHRVKHFKCGRVLRVKKVVTYHLTTRLMLTNGTYITGNKAQVLAQ
ncbi:MucBP domain-containing protein, partial [Levilactobacillus spicheri]